MSKVNARARVTVTIEIGVKDRWNSECAVDQIRRQAIESAIQELHDGASIAHNGRYGTRSAYAVFGKPNWALIGEPKVEAVIIGEDAPDVEAKQPRVEPPSEVEVLQKKLAEVEALYNALVERYAALQKDRDGYKQGAEHWREAAQKREEEVRAADDKATLRARKQMHDEILEFIKAHPMTGDRVYERMLAVLEAFLKNYVPRE